MPVTEAELAAIRIAGVQVETVAETTVAFQTVGFRPAVALASVDIARGARCAY